MMANKLLVPDDWNETTDGYTTFQITVPNSPYWRANVKGQLLILALPINWDSATGNIETAAEIGSGIFESITEI